MTIVRLLGAAFLTASLALAVGSADAKTFKMATSWGGGPHLEDLAKGFAARAKFLTNGEVEFEVFPGGTMGSPLKVVETVRNGVTEAGHHWPGYDWGVDKTAVLFGGYAGSMPEEYYMHWLFAGEGRDLWMQWRREKHGVVGFPCGTHSDEVHMHSRKRIQEIADLKGLKLRTSGAWAEIAQTFGASTVVLPGAEVYPALERGTVDAIEWATPWINHKMGFNKIAKYVILPGVHQASSSQECVFKVDVWESFSDRTKELLLLAGKILSLDAFMMFNNGDVDAIRDFIKEGNEIVIVSDDYKAQVREATNAWIDKTIKEEGGWFQKVIESQRKFMQRWETAPMYRTDLRVLK